VAAYRSAGEYSVMESVLRSHINDTDVTLSSQRAT
jgi:hypothetical protein